MASFIAYYGKKRCRLAKLKREFMEVLHNDAGQTRVAEAAEAIRAAQIRALKEKRQKFAPSEKNAALYAKIEEAICWWKDVSPESLVEGLRDPRCRRQIPAAVREAAK